MTQEENQVIAKIFTSTSRKKLKDGCVLDDENAWPEHIRKWSKTAESADAAQVVRVLAALPKDEQWRLDAFIQSFSYMMFDRGTEFEIEENAFSQYSVADGREEFLQELIHDSAHDAMDEITDILERKFKEKLKVFVVKQKRKPL